MGRSLSCMATNDSLRELLVFRGLAKCQVRKIGNAFPLRLASRVLPNAKRCLDEPQHTRQCADDEQPQRVPRRAQDEGYGDQREQVGAPVVIDRADQDRRTGAHQADRDRCQAASDNIADGAIGTALIHVAKNQRESHRRHQHRNRHQGGAGPSRQLPAHQCDVQEVGTGRRLRQGVKLGELRVAQELVRFHQIAVKFRQDRRGTANGHEP